MISDLVDFIIAESLKYGRFVLAKYLNSPDSDWYKNRLTGAVFIAMAAFFILLARLFHLQIIEGQEYRRLSQNNCIRLQSVDSLRGQIYDRNGELLVDNRPAFDVSIIPRDAKPVDATLAMLSRYGGFSREEMGAVLKGKKGYRSYKPVLLKRDVGRDTLAAIEAHKFDLPGISVDVKPRRHYIVSRKAAHVLGYLSEINSRQLDSGEYPGAVRGDFVGKFGLEKVFENDLRGKRGGRQVEVDARGRVIRVLHSVEPIPGRNLILTLDGRLQAKAEELLQGKEGALVAMDPSSGEVLAMASSPTFDQNDFVSGLSYEKWGALRDNPYRPMENKAIQAEYPPASIYKIVTAIAALEEGIVDENTRIRCSGYHKYGNRGYRCWKKTGHGSVDIKKALAESCDVFFYVVGQKIGVDRLAFYAKACGLGKPTGIELDHEEGGLVPTAAWKKKRLGEVWHGGETLSLAIGQSYNLVTPLQMASLISSVANGGTLYRPTLLKRIETSDGTVVKEGIKTMVGRLPVSEKTLAIVRRGLWETVNSRHGTAKIIKMDNIEISGKTGTAEVVSRRRGESGKKQKSLKRHRPHAWFVAFAPAENPRIAVSVMVEHGEQGSRVAAPLAGAIIKTYLQTDAQ